MWVQKNVLFLCIAYIFVLTCVSAQSNSVDVGVEISDEEKLADELIRNGRIKVWELLLNENFRNIASEFLATIKTIVETKSSSKILTGVTLQIKDTLTDAQKGVVSVRNVIDGVYKLFIDEQTSKTIKGILDSAFYVMKNSDTSVLLSKVFDLLVVLTKLHRGSEVITAFGNGTCGILQRKNVKPMLVNGFKSLHYLLSTSVNNQVKNFVKG